ncbi:MAG: hypothetical protein WBR28_12030 [Mycobacterium sp.]
MAEKDPDSDPGTAAFVPDFDDTGEDSLPFVPNFDDTGSEPLPRVTESKPKDEPERESESESVAAPVAVPGRYQYVTWWKLLLVLLGVWFAAAEVGLSLFYWWYHTVDKTAAVYMVLVYVVACVVAGVILAMVQARPMMSALALAVMSGPFASIAAAAPLYGHYYCERVGHCLSGLIPY